MAEAPQGTSKRILVVEDDAASRKFIQIALQRIGYQIDTVDCVDAAQNRLMAEGYESFDCVVTDYRMPGPSGLDLLAWLKVKAPSLATIILTGEGEKSLITESLRGGAADFLEKPVDIKHLREAVGNAIQITHLNRHAAEVQSAVKQMGRTQQWLLKAQTAKVLANVDIHFHPKLDAGGDFFCQFKPSQGKYCCLLTDVSGHDLQAAYVSAYFQGAVRGMLDCGANLSEIFNYFNQLLLDEWDVPKPFQSDSISPTSLAVCSLLINYEQNQVDILTCGAPAPIYIAPNGRAERMGEHGGYPLGWFSNIPVPHVTHEAHPGSSFLLWTDGMEDLAEKKQVSVLSLGYALCTAQSTQQTLTAIQDAPDDILFTRVYLSGDQNFKSDFFPLIVERYSCNQIHAIDDLGLYWLRSLQFAFPAISESLQHDMMLASREALLNALIHGCKDKKHDSVLFQISFHPENHLFRIWVEDPGTGHTFDIAAHEKVSSSQAVESHRGLILMKNLSNKLYLEGNGTIVIMDFQQEGAVINRSSE